MELNNTNLTLFHNNLSSLYDYCIGSIFEDICNLVEDLQLDDFSKDKVEWGVDLSDALNVLLNDLPFISFTIQVKQEDYNFGFFFINIPKEYFFKENQNWNDFKVVLKNTNLQQCQYCEEVEIYLIKKDLRNIVIDNI